MADIAILGYGIVGSGVAEVLDRNAEGIANRCGSAIRVKHILDVRKFPLSPHQALLTDRMEDILSDPDITIVVETIGGTSIAHELTCQALKTGHHVVTSNKELVAVHGPELLELAAQNHVHYLFEASVGGGIPIIRPLAQCLAANSISRVVGILNGTTNYILTQMRRHGTDFDTALQDAQKRGYAEANPSADIDGHDACRKIAILSSIAYDTFIDCVGIQPEGISKISATDMAYAEKLEGAIRLIAESKRTDRGIVVRVGPVIVPLESPLANVDDVFNAILVEGDALGEAMFYGRGAGKFPTASAVVADIIDIVRNPDAHGRHRWQRPASTAVIDSLGEEAQWFVRIRTGKNGDEARRLVSCLFEQAAFQTLEREDTRDELAFLTGREVERELRRKLETLEDALKRSAVNPSAGGENLIVNVLRYGC